MLLEIVDFESCGDYDLLLLLDGASRELTRRGGVVKVQRRWDSRRMSKQSPDEVELDKRSLVSGHMGSVNFKNCTDLSLVRLLDIFIDAFARRGGATKVRENIQLLDEEEIAHYWEICEENARIHPDGSPGRAPQGELDDEIR